VVRAAELTHAADAYLGMLLAGSTAPVLAAVLLIRQVLRRRAQRQGPARRPKVIVARGGAA
jgi:hypothetical protein